MFRHDRQLRNKKAPKHHQEPSGAKATPIKEEQPLTLDQELALAAIMNRLLPSADFHGKTRRDVQFEIDLLFNQNPGQCVRIIYGHGTGVMESAVMTYLRQLQTSKNNPILAIRADVRTHSVVVRLK